MKKLSAFDSCLFFLLLQILILIANFLQFDLFCFVFDLKNFVRLISKMFLFDF